MLEITTLRNEKPRVLEGLAKRNITDADQKVAAVISLDDDRKRLQTELDDMLAERNTLSKQIGDLFKQGKADEAKTARERVGTIKDEVAKLEDQLRDTKASLEEQLLDLPNVPHTSVPAGAGEDDNEVYQAHEGDLPVLGEGAKPHWELADEYDIFSLELGVKLTGAGFPVFRGQGARLQRALITFFLNEAHKAGYEEFVPPLLVNEDSARGTGQLPDKEGQMYHVTKDELYLIPTAEVPLTNIFRDEILAETDFPVKITGFTPCFRREAGSYGAHVRGLNRVHQFDKVEIVRVAHPDKSYDDLMEMVDYVGGLLDALGLPFRILRLCGGDTGFVSALTFDFEVWSAAQQRWLEVSSVSNFETYQANRLKLRYRDAETGKTRLAHTLNGSALALPRIIAALLENNQTEEGIRVPEVLQGLLGQAMLVRK
ncbi:serine--tRNA ligase [Lewinellaceae bacterium SD302]|nr:serine--tRNA ligase [Lewinellaceae bacterium SD302]